MPPKKQVAMRTRPFCQMHSHTHCTSFEERNDGDNKESKGPLEPEKDDDIQSKSEDNPGSHTTGNNFVATNADGTEPAPGSPVRLEEVKSLCDNFLNEDPKPGMEGAREAIGQVRALCSTIEELGYIRRIRAAEEIVPVPVDEQQEEGEIGDDEEIDIIS